MVNQDSPQPTARSGSSSSSSSTSSVQQHLSSELHGIRGIHGTTGTDATTASLPGDDPGDDLDRDMDPHHEDLQPLPVVTQAVLSPSSSSALSSSSRPGSAQRCSLDGLSYGTPPALYLSELPALDVRTDVSLNSSSSPLTSSREFEPFVPQSILSGSLPQRTPSFGGGGGGGGLHAGRKSSISSLSPATSVMSSPQLTAMGDITPLPSPIGGAAPWRLSRTDVSLSRTPSMVSRGSSLSLRLSDSTHRFGGRSTSRSRTRPYTSGERGGDTTNINIPEEGTSSTPKYHARNRSLSDYVPPKLNIPMKPRPIVASGSGPSIGITPSVSTDLNNNSNKNNDSNNHGLHREQHLAVHRGIALPASRPLTPPRSSRGPEDERHGAEPVISRSASLGSSEEIYSVRSIRSDQPRKYRKLCQLGQGTFSQVALATRMDNPYSTNPRKLVAVKVIDYGPAGGADEERLEVSLKREVDILKSINHPSLVQLKAFGSDEKRALLVLDYCPGGDLFDIASSSSRPMSPSLTRRIFAELVHAVRYLHENFIVHRDIKLENVLVTIPTTAMDKPIDWRTYNHAVVTLSDLGLSRRIPEPPESPLLHTRCGSEDYAAPEILMGQPYDGRSTDAWALGVSLYAMMENRLPFDALPGTRGDPAKLRARTPHRIARCDWAWYRYADEDGEWDVKRGVEWKDAHLCVEALLKRNTRRKSLAEIAAMTWVRDAIDVPGGLKRGDQEVP